jgi:hypothetical protein
LLTAHSDRRLSVILYFIQTVIFLNNFMQTICKHAKFLLLEEVRNSVFVVVECVWLLTIRCENSVNKA